MVFAPATSSQACLAADQPAVLGIDSRFAQSQYAARFAAHRDIDVPGRFAPARQLSLWADAHLCSAPVDAFCVVVFQELIFLFWTRSSHCRSPQDLSSVVSDLLCIQEAVACSRRPYCRTLLRSADVTLSFRTGRVPALCFGGFATSSKGRS